MDGPGVTGPGGVCPGGSVPGGPVPCRRPAAGAGSVAVPPRNPPARNAAPRARGAAEGPEPGRRKRGGPFRLRRRHGQEARRGAGPLPAAAARPGPPGRRLMGRAAGPGAAGGSGRREARADGGVLSRQLHASEVGGERGPELRSAAEQSPLEEFLATAELAGTRFVAGEGPGQVLGCGWARGGTRCQAG